MLGQFTHVHGGITYTTKVGIIDTWALAHVETIYTCLCCDAVIYLTPANFGTIYTYQCCDNLHMRIEKEKNYV
jgi:hypothetical protein